MDLVFKAQLLSGDKTHCPHCGRYAQVYKRPIHATIAKQLIMMLKHGGDDCNYVHASMLIPDGQTGQGDLTKAKYFGLIKAMPETSDAKKSSGFWSLTEDGYLFVTGKKDIPEYVVVFDDKVIGVSQEKIFITDALASGGFNYSDVIQSWIIKGNMNDDN